MRQCPECPKVPMPRRADEVSAPFALTEDDLPVLERWIRERGHEPVRDVDTNETIIVCSTCRQVDCKCTIPF